MKKTPTSRVRNISRTELSCIALVALFSTCATQPALASPHPPSDAAQATGVPAESAGGANPDGDIIVTARKREETSLQVPVTISAVGAGELERRAITSLDNLTRIVPSLQIGAGGGAIQGGNVVIRGISGGDVNPFGDQAVSFNVDGVQVARAIVRRMASMDMQQIEVLKGPQALFFGKNSPGGVISITTADPTTRLEAKASVGYEFNAHELRGEGYVSGPLTDSLGARLAFYGSTMRGWVDNDFSGGGIYTPQDKHLPKSREVAVRGTLKFDNGGPFSARFKFTHNRLWDAGALTTEERVDCPLGVPQAGGGPDDCQANGRTARLDFGPNVAALDSRFKDGVPYLKQFQSLSSLELNYNISDALTLTSVSGFYQTRSRVADNFSLAFNPAAGIASSNDLKFREMSQELRLRSDFDGAINFLIGGYAQDSKAYVAVITAANYLAPVVQNNFAIEQRGTSISGFAQLMVKPIDVIEITGGARYSYERKHLPFIAASTAPGVPALVPQNPAVPRRESWNDLSPEFTVSYRPTQRLTVFGSYKKGFLSGGFNSGQANFNNDLRYDQQTIRGFEGGIKASLLNGALRANLSAYRYTVAGLQVTSNFQSGNIIVQQVTNAGKVTTKGIEGDLNYRVPNTGLTLRSAVSYNDGRYNQFTVACYRGQTQSLGCNAGSPSAAGLYSLQDLAGRQMVRAPKWTGTIGVGYQTDVGSDLRASINADGSYSDGYYSDPTQSPGSYQRHYATLDATADLGHRDGRWTVAIIGRNLTNKYYYNRSNGMPGTGTAPGGVTGTRADTIGYLSRGREIMLRVSTKFGG